MAPPPPPPIATTAHHDNQSDSISTTSAASTPRSSNQNDPRLRFMCSFGGKIVPRPHDNQLRYVGGDTRIIAINRHTTFAAMIAKLAKTVGTVVSYNNLTVKYQLPNEDLDALISVSNDEDVENMMDEYDRVGSKTGRLRLFLFDEISRTTSISSILNGSMKRESWFFDALNGGGGSMSGGAVLERGYSEASSIVSEVPDYLFGLENSDEPVKTRTRSNLADCISYSDPGSPAPVISSSASTPPPFVSTPLTAAVVTTAAATHMVQNFAPVKAKIETVTIDPPCSVPAGLLQGNTMWQYNPDPNYPVQIQTPMTTTTFQPVPVYYIPAPAQPGNYPVQPGPIQTQFVQQQQQIPIGYHPMGMIPGMVPGMGQIHGVPNGPMLRPMGVGLESYDGVNHLVPGYYGQQQQVHVYPAGNVVAGAEDHTRSGSDTMGNGAGQ